jgi:ketol-acid reductoisomerase
MANYFNTLNLRQQLAQLGKCRFMARDEFADGASYLQGKKVVIVGCGAQGLNQGLNMRDSGLDISYALRKEAIAEKRFLAQSDRKRLQSGHLRRADPAGGPGG